MKAKNTQKRYLSMDFIVSKSLISRKINVAPQSQGVFFFFFFTTVRSLSQQRNLYRDRIPLSCMPSLGAPTLSCASSLVCRSRIAFSVATQRNAMPHYHDKAPLSRAHNLVATQCLAPLLRHRTLCRNMEDLMSWNSVTPQKYPRIFIIKIIIYSRYN